MNSATRQIFFRLYAIFFIVITPFIIIYSLGYDLNWQSRSLSKNLIVNINTIPSGAQVDIENSVQFKTPVELRFSTNSPQQISISKDGFREENIVIWSDLDSNTNLRIDNYSLLPDTFDPIYQLPKQSSFLNFLPKNKYLYEVNNLLFLQDYDPLGVNNPIPITNQIPFDKFKSGDWEDLGLNYFWNYEEKLILYFDQTTLTWNSLDINTVILEAHDIARVSNSSFLVLDNQSNLFIWEPADEIVSFLDSGYNGLESRQFSESIWLIKENNLIRLNKNRVSYTNILDSEDKFLYSMTTDTIDENIDLKVKNSFRGVSLKMGEDLIYLNDVEPQKVNIISKNIKNFTTTKNSIIYLDKDNNLGLYNFEFNTQKNLAKLSDSDVSKIHYSEKLNRILLYSNSVESVWFDIDEIHSNIIQYPYTEWIDNPNCQIYTEDRYQMCVRDGELIRYSNFTRW